MKEIEEGTQKIPQALYHFKKLLPMAIYLAISFLFYGVYLDYRYSTDTYSIITSEWTKWLPQLLMGSARFSMSFFTTLFGLLNIDLARQQILSSLFAILMFSVIAFFTFRMLVDLDNKSSHTEKVLLFLSVSTIFFAYCFADWYQWVEVLPFYEMGLLLAILSGYILIKCKQTTLNFLLSVFLLIISLGFYQSYGFYYLMASFLLLINDIVDNKINGSLKNVLLKFIRISTVYLLSNGFCLIVMKYYGSKSRTDFSKLNFFRDVVNSLPNQYQFLKNSKGLLPNGLLIITLGLTLVFLVYALYKYKSHKRKTVVFCIICTYAFLYVSIFIPNIMGGQAEWMAHRTVTGLIAFPAITCIFIYFILKACLSQDGALSGEKIRKIHYFLIIILSIFLAVNYYQTQRIAKGLFVTNSLDCEITKYYFHKITSYEEKNNTVIKKISFCQDKQVTYFYPGVLGSYMINMREYSYSWPKVSLFKFVTGRTFEQIKMDNQIYEKYFKDKQWDNISDEQIVFEGDTVYICIY